MSLKSSLAACCDTVPALSAKKSVNAEATRSVVAASLSVLGGYDPPDRIQLTCNVVAAGVHHRHPSRAWSARDDRPGQIRSTVSRMTRGQGARPDNAASSAR
jgi:hypothetical protein